MKTFIVKPLIYQVYIKVFSFLIIFLNLLSLWVTNVSDVQLLLLISIPLTKSPDVMPDAQNIESPVTISLRLYFLLRS